jgi:hypothetical protein
LLGIAEVRSGQPADAHGDLEASFPQIEDPKFKIQVGLELVGVDTQSNDLTAAAAVIAQLQKAAPENPEALYASYRTYSDLMIQSMLALALVAPNAAQMHQVLAEEELKRGDTNDAITEYTRRSP